jgi:hypothetical protein
MKEKLRRSEKDVDSLREEIADLRKDCEKDSDRFVTHQHLTAVIGPIHRSIEMVQKDVKEILRVVSSPSNHPTRR